jgi:RimJ/RimL family protein N-acetyltransferase
MPAPAPDFQLETARLILRPPAREDFGAWCVWGADAEAMKHLGGVMPPAVTWRSLRLMAGNWALDGYSMFSVIEKATGRWIGRLGPWQPHDWPGTEVGWGLVREAWGKGYATEGATAAIDWAFDHLGWTEVVHTIAPDNTNSQAVARRLGSTVLRDDRLPAPFNSPTVVWGQTREQWQARRR